MNKDVFFHENRDLTMAVFNLLLSDEYAGLDDISQRPSSSSTSSSSSSRAGVEQRGISNPNNEDPCTQPLLDSPDNPSES